MNSPSQPDSRLQPAGVAGKEGNDGKTLASPLAAPLSLQMRRYADFLRSLGAVPFDPASLRAQLDLEARFQAFLTREPRPFHRETLAGHVTGSACVASADFSRLLLMHHRKLGRWLQPGGHSDGEPETWNVALREAREETGIEGLGLVPPFATAGCAEILPLDLDVHTIPARGDEPGHLHWDVRYLIIPTEGEAAPEPVMNAESHGLRWVALEEVGNLTREESVLRLARKVEWVRRVRA